MSISPTFKLAPFDKTDLGPDGQYAHFVALKKKNPKLKTLLSVGGWTHSDPPNDWIFSAMAETPEGRKQFIDSAIKYLRENGFDVPVDDATQAKFVEMRYLESSIGRTGLLALQPMCHMSHRDLWQLYMLGK